jgi:fluoride ion exporter CrcB/FEX
MTPSPIPPTRQETGEIEKEKMPQILEDGESPNNSALHEQLRQHSRKAIKSFFYPNRGGIEPEHVTESGESSSSSFSTDEEENRLFVEQFWKYYDDIIILSIFTQFGIIFRLAAAGWFSYFDGTFRAGSALFVNLPLNSLSCFILGCMASGPDLMNIIETRFTPDFRQEEHDESSQDEGREGNQRFSPRLERLRRRKRHRIYHYHRKKGDSELRQVQILALERRIRASPSLLLFPVAKEEADLMEHYFQRGYRYREREEEEELETAVGESETQEECQDDMMNEETKQLQLSRGIPNSDAIDYGTTNSRDIDQIIYDVSSSFAGHVQNEAKNLTCNFQRLTKVTLADGWDVGTTPEAMCEDLLLGLRDGFCGALSSFSSWNSSMVSLIREGNVQEALVGYLIGLQLPLVSYRFGQHVAVYIFVWRCRREVRSDERRGYGIRLSQNEHSLDLGEEGSDTDMEPPLKPKIELPSVRAIATAFFIMSMLAQVTSLNFYKNPEDQLVALSLLFSPFGVMARWRLSRYNDVRQGFPLGTFSCNMLACALHGSLGSLLAGNPGPRERIVLVAFISGFGGTLSSVAAFIVEVLRGIDPLLLRLSGVYYASSTIFWGMVIGLITISGVDWADRGSGNK